MSAVLIRLNAASRGPPTSTNLAADEKRPESIEVERRLLCLPHHLNDCGQRIQILSDQADDEVVVVAIESVTRETDIVDVIRRTELHPDLAVLGQNRPLLLRRQLRERSAAAQRIPNRPRPVWVHQRAQRTLHQDIAEIRLV